MMKLREPYKRRPDALFFLNDLQQIDGNLMLAQFFLANGACRNNVLVEWETCLQILRRKLSENQYDFCVAIGERGLQIYDSLRQSIPLGVLLPFYITRLSNPNWEKVAYVHGQGKPCLKLQLEEIIKHLKGYPSVAVIDDVTYSGGTRNALREIRRYAHRFDAIDLITLKAAKKEHRYYDHWYSGVLIREPPFPFSDRVRQADVMNLSEFLFPSKIIGKVTQGQCDAEQILWEGSYKVLKHVPYTDSRQRNRMYFGVNAGLMKKFSSIISEKVLR